MTLHSTVADSFAAWLVRWRAPLLVVGVVLAVGAWWPARQLRFDQTIEAMFAPRDPVLEPYRALKRTFGGNEVVLAAYVDDALLSPAGYERLAAATGQLEKVPGVAAVLSLSKTPLQEAIIEQENPVARKFVELFTGYCISADRRTAAVVCLLEPGLGGGRDEAKPPQDAAEIGDEGERGSSRITRREVVDELREIIVQYPSGTVAGEPVLLADSFRALEGDGRLLAFASTALLTLVIAASFRSVRWVLIPLAVVQLSLWLTQAILYLSGLQLTMVSSMLAALVTIVGVATVVHLIVRYRAEREAGHEGPAAMQRAIAALLWPIVGACFTDAVGFGSLLLAHVGPVRDFGLMAAIGSVLVLPATALLVPGMALVGGKNSAPKRSWGEAGLQRFLQTTLRRVTRHAVAVAAATVVVAALLLAGMARLKVETDFTKNFRAGSPIVASYEFVETRLGGAGVLDVILPAPKTLTAEYLDRVRKLEQRLRTEVFVVDAAGQQQPGLTAALSLADVIDAGLLMSPKLPLANLEVQRLSTTIDLLRVAMPKFIDALHGRDPLVDDEENAWRFRLMLRAKERQSAEQKQRLIAEITRVCGEEMASEISGGNVPGLPAGATSLPAPNHQPPTTNPLPATTGFFVLLARLIDSILADQWVTFAAATIGIGTMMLVAFRGVKLALIALVPNLLPIFATLGILGWLGLRINMGTAMIAAVSMGLSIDSSIHYLVAYRRARREGATCAEALSQTHASTGTAIFFATLALIAGFSALCFSQFVPTVYFGALASLTMLGGLVGNLVVLPVMLVMCDGDNFQSH